MNENEKLRLVDRVNRIRNLSKESNSGTDYFEAAMLAQSVLHDTVGAGHPLMAAISRALDKADWNQASAASRSVVRLFDEGGLVSPRLAIAHEIEGSLLDEAQSQIQAAEKSQDATNKQMHLVIAALLGGVALEDALRRLCDANGVVYDAQSTSISKLQATLYQPSKQIELITSSENKQITAWGDTRNKVAHGKFSDISHTEVFALVMGTRTFIDKYLP